MKNRRVLTELFDKTFLRCGDKSLGLIVQIFEQLTHAFVVEFGVDIIEQKQRIFAARGMVNRDIGQLQREQSASLLAGRAEFSQIVPVKQDLQIVAVRPDQRVSGAATPDVAQG